MPWGEALRENSLEKEIGSDKRISNGRWASRGTPYKANLESRSLPFGPSRHHERIRGGGALPLLDLDRKKE